MTRRPQKYAAGRGDLVVVLDCSDLGPAADFWAGALGYVRDGDSDGTYQSLLPADGSGVELLLQRVPETKAGTKNRVHLDLRTRDLDAEVARLRELGAQVLTVEAVEEDGWTWHVLADRDGNELCVIRPTDDYWATEG